MVRMKGLEPSHLSALAPKTNVSTNSTTSAWNFHVIVYDTALFVDSGLRFVVTHRRHDSGTHQSNRRTGYRTER